MSEPFQMMPPLAADEYESLKADIAANGIRVPIDVDQWGRILDGHHRSRIAAEIGIDPPKRLVEVHSDEAARQHALSCNTTGRQLNQEQRRQVVANSLRADPAVSDRVHARRCGASPSTVGAVRKELEDCGELSKLDSRTGADGKARPVSYAEPTPPLPKWRYPDDALLADALRVHGIADVCEPLTIFPSPGMDAHEWDRLCRSVARSGVSLPVTVTESGTLVDGRSRIMAATLTGTTAPVKRIPDPDDPEELVAWVRYLNVFAQTTTPGERYTVGVMLDRLHALEDGTRPTGTWADRDVMTRDVEALAHHMHRHRSQPEPYDDPEWHDYGERQTIHAALLTIVECECRGLSDDVLTHGRQLVDRLAPEHPRHAEQRQRLHDLATRYAGVKA